MAQGNNGDDNYDDAEHNEERRVGSDEENAHAEKFGGDNVIRIPSPAEREAQRRTEEKDQKKLNKKRERMENEYRAMYRIQHGDTFSTPGRVNMDGENQPMINLPPVTKYFAGILVAIQIIIGLVLSPDQQFWLIGHLGFVPSAFTAPFNHDASPMQMAGISSLNYLGVFTYIFLHGGWIHLGMNVLMLMAFGAGVERWLGSKRYVALFMACSLIAAVIHLLVNPFSFDPVIGASGGISGLFAAVLVLLQQSGRLPTGKYGLLPMILLWVGISILFGTLGGPGGETIAWVAHIGGFLAGFILLKPIMRMKV